MPNAAIFISVTCQSAAVCIHVYYNMNGTNFARRNEIISVRFLFQVLFELVISFEVIKIFRNMKKYFRFGYGWYESNVVVFKAKQPQYLPLKLISPFRIRFWLALPAQDISTNLCWNKCTHQNITVVRVQQQPSQWPIVYKAWRVSSQINGVARFSQPFVSKTKSIWV